MPEMSGAETMRGVWEANGAVNEALLSHLTPEMLHAQTPGGGFTVAQHLAHMAGTTKYWAKVRGEAAMRGVPNLYDETAEAFVAETAETNLDRIGDVLRQTRDAAWEAAAMTDGAPNEWGEGPHATPTAYLAHMLIHDAHHRGQILLALKTNGFSLPNEDALWAPLREAR